MTTRESSVALPSEKRPTRLIAQQSIEKIRKIQAVWRGYQHRKQFEHIRRKEVAQYPYFSADEVKETLDKPIELKDDAYTYRNGARYVGQWQGGFRHGRGAMAWPDGAQYDGQWQYSRPWGRGTFTHVDGEVFQGSWKVQGRDGYGES